MSLIKDKLKALLPNTLKYKIKNRMNSYYNYCMLKKYKKVKPYEKGKYPYGINLIGDVRAETGLGQSMRLLASVLQENEIPFVIIQVDQPGNLAKDNDSWNYKIEKKPKYAVNLIHINTSEWAENYTKLPTELLEARYNIAYWLWELEDFPKQWLACIKTIDAIWTPSEFICQCLRKNTDKPVVKVPYRIELQEPVKYGREHFELPENVFLFLMMYDFKSISERKNPKGMVEAFRKAFSPEKANEEKVGLVIKVNHVEDYVLLQALKKELEEYQYIYYITDNLSRAEVESLVASVDVYISLHRSEGFGLPAAEAMYLGTPVIATNWSATTEFMSRQTACLVDYDMVVLERPLGPYPKGSRWADADITQAADYMVKLYQDKAYYQDISQNAKQSIRLQLNSRNVGNIMESALSMIDKIDL
jgi:glycosyltransferase involved in cell wall biosynthesis